MLNIKKSHRSDVLGITSSGLCMIHCALTPIILTAKPVIDSAINSSEQQSSLWGMFDILFLILSFIAVYYSSRHTNNKTIKSLLWLFWIVFAIGLSAEFFEISYGLWIMYIGSFALIFTHIQNLRQCQKCNVEAK